MSINLIRDLLEVDQVIGEESSETLIENDVIIPDMYPDIKKVLSANSSVVVDSKEILQDKVVIDGRINYFVMYIAEDEDNSIRSMKSTANFNHSMEMPGIKPKMRADICSEIQHTDYEIVNKRKLSIKTVTDFHVKVNDKIQVEIVKDIEGIENLQLLRDKAGVVNQIGEKKSQTIVKEDLEIPDDKPPAKAILKSDVKIREKESKVSDNKVIVQGIVELKTLYIADNDASSLETINHEISFSHFVEVQYASPGMNSNVSFILDDISVDIKDNIIGEPRILDTEAVLTINCRVQEYYHIDLISDCYCPSRNLTADCRSIKFTEEVSRQKAETEIKEIIELSENQPSIRNIYGIDSSVVITDYGINEDEVIIEGILGVTCIYEPHEGNGILESLSQEVPFKYTIDVPGAAEGMDADITCDIIDTNGRIAANNQIEAVFNMAVDVSVVKTVESNVVISVTEEEIEGQKTEQAGITVYFVQPEDTLWEIAKRYNTTLEELCRINSIQEPEEVNSGTKILIYRGIKYNIS